MLIRWSKHAKLRFAERAAAFNINYGDIEIEIKKQTVKVKESENRFRTIFEAGKKFLTAVKVEKKEFIHVLTLWEATEKEVEEWKKKK